MDLPFLGLWYVCGLGAAVFGAGLPLRPVPVATAAASFAAMTWWVAPAGVVDVASAALATVVVAAWDLTRSTPRFAPALMAGGLAGAWTGVLAFQGLPPAAAIAVAALVPTASALLAARRAGFAPHTMRDEALLFLCALALLASALPSVLDGWRAAGNLSPQSTAPAPELIPLWALVATASAAALGDLYSVWSRR